MRAVGSSITHQRIRRIIDIRILVTAEDPEVAHESASGPLSHGLGIPGKCYLRNNLWMTEPL